MTHGDEEVLLLRPHVKMQLAVHSIALLYNISCSAADTLPFPCEAENVRPELSCACASGLVFGRDLPAESEEAKMPLHGPNQWPPEVSPYTLHASMEDVEPYLPVVHLHCLDAFVAWHHSRHILLKASDAPASTLSMSNQWQLTH